MSYLQQTNIISSTKYENPCHSKQSDLQNYSSSYHLGPIRHQHQDRQRTSSSYDSCPYYNYILPNSYPYQEGCHISYPSPKLYWYYPYYKNDNFWNEPVCYVYHE